MYRVLKTSLLTFLLFSIVSLKTFGLSSFFLNENGIISERERINLLLEYQTIQRYLPSMTEYTTTKISLKGIYPPNSNVELGFEIPYFKINEANDSGTLGDIRLSSKFSVFKELFEFIDMFIFQTTFNLKINLATGIKKEDSYRNIGLQKTLYYPLSSGYSDLEIGFSSSLVGTIFAISVCSSFISVSSKIEPPLAFNTENDNIMIGTTLELFLHYSKDFNLKIFGETTYFIPVSEKSKYQDILLIGGGLWSRFFKNGIIKIGYYKNLLEPKYLENTFNNTVIISIGVRI